MRKYNNAITCKRRVGCGSLYVTLIYSEHHEPLAVQLILGKAGGCAASQLNGIQTLINYIIKNKLPLEPLLDKHSTYSLLGIRCPEILPEDEDFAEAPDEKLNLSCNDVIAKSLRYLLTQLEEMKPKKK